MTYPFTDITARRHPLWADILCMLGVFAVLSAFAIKPFYAGPGYGDESYQALCVRYWSQSPLAMYTFWKGYLWTSVFGDSYLSLRFLSCLTTVTAIALACCYLGWRTRSWRNGAWMFVLCGSMGFIETNLMYNWDIGPSVLYVICACASMEYWRTERLWALCMIAISVTLLALSRVQLVVAVPVGAIFVWFAHLRHDDRKLRYCKACAIAIAFIVMCAMIFLAMTSIMLGSPARYFVAFVSDNIITGHSLQSLSRYISLPLYFLGEFVGHQILSLGALCVGLWLSVGSVTRKKTFVGLLVSGALGVLMALYFCQDSGMDAGFNSAGMVLIMGVLLFLPAYRCMQSAPADSQLTALLFLLWVIYLLPAFGSDIYIMRLNACCLLPVAVYLVHKEADRHLYRLLTNTLAAATLSFFMAMLMKIALMPVYLPEKIEDMPRLSGLRTESYRLNDLNEMYRLYQTASDLVGSDRVTFYGDARYSFSYSFQTSPIPYLHKFHTLDEDAEAQMLETLTASYDAFIFCYVMRRDIAKIDPVLRSNGFIQVYGTVSNSQGEMLPETQMNVMYVRTDGKVVSYSVNHGHTFGGKVE